MMTSLVPSALPMRSEYELLLGYPGVTGIRELLLTFVGPGRVWLVARIDVDGGLYGVHVESLVRGVLSRE